MDQKPEIPKFDLLATKTWTVPQLFTDEGFAFRIATHYDSLHPGGALSGLDYYKDEVNNFRKAFLESAYIQKCTATSIALAFINVAHYGLSLKVTEKPQAYITPKKGTNIGELRITGYGELAIRIDSGTILGVYGPTLVHKGDPFVINDGVVDHKGLEMSPIIRGGWIRIIKPDGTFDDKYFSIEQILSYKAKSDNQDGYAWTGGVAYKDEDGKEVKQPTRGMIEAKILKHCFSTYPRLKLHPGAKLEDDDSAAAKEAAYATLMADITGGSSSPADGDDDQSWDAPEVVEETPAAVDEWGLPPETPVEQPKAAPKTKAPAVEKPGTKSTDAIPTFW